MLASNKVAHLVMTVTQLPLASTSVESPRRLPRLKARPILFFVAAAVKIKQKFLGFKLDDKTIYAWFFEDLKPFFSTSTEQFWTYPTQGMPSPGRRGQ
jgi:hypothetical protein